jgi:UDP-N-acetyl-2-amino-2-deoxyglucuronate dehydrogenase
VPSELRAALVGCGRISKNHIDAIAAVDGIRLSAVADIVPERARAVGESLGIPWFSSLDEMLASAACDVVVVTTPSGLHPEHAIAAAKAGKHVITEKPMAISLAGADAMIAACEAAGKHLFVVKQNRLNPPVQLLRRAIDKGRFGRIYMANCTVWWSRPQEYYDQAPWRGTWAYDGGAFLNQASHYIDLMQWLLGEPESVVASTATLARNIEAEDTGAAVVTFKSRAIGVFEVTMLTYPKNLEGSITIIGETGTVTIGGTAVNRVEHWQFADYDDDDKLVDQAQTNPPTVYGFGHVGYYRNVVSVLSHNGHPDTDGREGRKSLELVLGIYKASRDGCAVSFPLSAE